MSQVTLEQLTTGTLEAVSPRQEAGPDAIIDRRYRVRREIAQGGMGSVMEVEHVVTEARLALKTLRSDALKDPVARERLLREARALGGLRHPSVVAVIDAGFCPVYGPFVAFEMIEGRPLEGLLVARGTLSVAQTTVLGVELSDVVAYVHRHGVLHRDIKPGNIIIADTPVGDRVELIDFGIAARRQEPSQRLTNSGELLCTVEYAAPEQLMNPDAVDERTDVYAIGASLYECLTGSVPIAGPPVTIIARHTAGMRAPSLKEAPDVPEALADVIDRALEPDPANRFQAAAELQQALLRAHTGPLPKLSLLTHKSTPPQRRQKAPAAAPPKRRFPRAPYVTPVRIRLTGGRSIDGRTEDISEGGVLLVTEGLCEADALVELKLPLPGSGRVVKLSARARWVRRHRDRRALGLELQDPPADVCSDIRRYVELMGSERG